eukprot:TRINITY_DN62088_c0_g1_i2.p1 TRINITY_DN62088_c0_g1~~TRINITY_DN62088_c0_g1_i2.p1  ORF type:complete len:130 (+),score=9.19 TRINITY_DN62088_c0_g1_i2:76-465(+)
MCTSYNHLLIYFLSFFFLMIRRPPRSTLSSSSAASDVYKRQNIHTQLFLGKAMMSRAVALKAHYKRFHENRVEKSNYTTTTTTIQLHTKSPHSSLKHRYIFLKETGTWYADISFQFNQHTTFEINISKM